MSINTERSHSEPQKFEGIRPYFDHEIPSAMSRIAESELFPLISSFVFPERNIEDVRNLVKEISTISEFQHKVMSTVNEQIIQRSTDGLTFNGLDYLDKDKSYLFVSNHRDIMLDSSLLQYILHTHGYDTSEITFGANLMCHPLVIDIGKSNKMFRVERGGNMKDFYKFSLLNSEYIRDRITDKHQSVWIAQRNGRTKDGIDRTEPGLIRMFASSLPDDKVRALDELNIVPISISYEWETCDILKTLELYSSRFTKYVKKPGEDLNSIITGIVAEKGKVHIEICKPISRDELEAMEGLTKQEYVKQVALLMDKRINSAYRLFPNNFIAHDMRYATKRYESRYTPQQRDRFREHLNQIAKYDDCDLNLLSDIFLGIYANPVDSYLAAIAVK